MTPATYRSRVADDVAAAAADNASVTVGLYGVGLPLTGTLSEHPTDPALVVFTDIADPELSGVYLRADFLGVIFE